MEIKDAITSIGISIDSYEDNYSNTVRVDFEALECIMAHVAKLEQREKQLKDGWIREWEPDFEKGETK